MTNDKFKPFAPKTYEQFVLEEQQTQSTNQDQRIADSYTSEVSAYGNLEVENGYGPCATCDKGESSPIEFKMACPAQYCDNRAPGYWYHNNDGCRESRMLITS